MNQEQWLEQAELYALGVLDQEARVLFERHLIQMEGEEEGRLLLDRISEVRESMTLFDKALPLQVPSHGIGEKIFVQVENEAKTQEQLESVFENFASVFSGHTLCVSVAVFLAAAFGWNFLTGQQEIARLNQIIVSLQESLQKSQPVMELISDKRTQGVELKGLGPSPEASAYIFWNPQTRQGFFSGRNLSNLTRLQVYELWALAGKQPVRAGIFHIDNHGVAAFLLPKLPADLQYDTFAVTAEPAGGTDQPTGAMHLAGKVSLG